MAARHARSHSVPSAKHPLISEFDELLSRLRSSQEASSSTSIATKLIRLRDLHDCVDQLLLLPFNQQALSKERNEKRVDELLDGSLRILEACAIAKEALSQTKESTQELQSLLRRRRDTEFDLATEVKKFLASRKMVNKTIRKAMENISSVVKHRESDEVVRMLGEVESITLAVFGSFFSFISGPKSQKSLVSKLMSSKRVVCEEDNEFESGVSALESLIGQKTKKTNSLLEEKAHKELQKLDMLVQDLEEGVECLYRCLVKTRVSLLNILNY